MVAEHSTLRVTAEPFIPQKVVGGEGSISSIQRAEKVVTPFRGVVGSFTPLKNKETNTEFATPPKQYRLRELSPEEIAAKAIRPSPVRPKKPFSPVALFESPLSKNVTRANRNSCSKLHCKRCAYREQQMAKGGPRKELEFQKEHDENCSFAGMETPETPSKTQDQQAVLSPLITVKPQIPVPELPKPQRRNVSVPTISEAITTSSNNIETSPLPSDRVMHTNVVSSASEASRPQNFASPKSDSSFVTSVNQTENGAPSSQQQLRAGLLMLVAVLLMLLLVQRNGVWKSVLRTFAAVLVALGTSIFLGPSLATRRQTILR